MWLGSPNGHRLWDPGFRTRSPGLSRLGTSTALLAPLLQSLESSLGLEHTVPKHGCQDDGEAGYF